MRVRVSGRFIVFVHGSDNPNDEEWSASMKALAELCHEPGAACLVYTDGGAPNAAQRAELKRATGERGVRIAVLTPSAAARAVGVAVRWFHPELRMFEPDAVDAALDHLSASSEERVVLRVALRELRQELRASIAP